MNGRQVNLDNTISSGEELVKENHFASDDIRNRINEVRQEWNNITDLAEKRRTKLQDAEALYQVRNMMRLKMACSRRFSSLVFHFSWFVDLFRDSQHTCPMLSNKISIRISFVIVTTVRYP